MQQLQQKAAQIKLLILDVDGVLTNGTFWLGPNGEEYKSFHTHDGYGIKALQRAGVKVAVISGRNSQAVHQRVKELDIEHYYPGCSDKRKVYEELVKAHQLQAHQVAAIGDDMPDLPILEAVGLSVAVANATAPLKNAVDWVTQNPGGQGAVRELCDLILNAQRQS